MSGLSKNDLDYFVRAIMPELYERKHKKDEFWEHLMRSLPQKETDVFIDPAINISINPTKLEEPRLSA